MTQKTEMRTLRAVRRPNSSVILVALPVALWREAGECSCPHCKGRTGYWDTLAVPFTNDRLMNPAHLRANPATGGREKVRDGSTYTVHAPEVHSPRDYEKKWAAETTNADYEANVDKVRHILFDAVCHPAVTTEAKQKAVEDSLALLNELV